MKYHVVLWKWRAKVTPYTVKYEARHVNALMRQLERWVGLEHRVLCVTDDASGVKCETFPLWSDLSHLHNASGQHLPSCYRRLKLFDPKTQEMLKIPAGDRVVSFDLDAVLTNAVDTLWLRSERFVGWHVAGTRHKTVFNGSMFMFTAGDLHELWSGFLPTKSPHQSLVAGYLGSDQGYLSHKLIGKEYVGGWTRDDGVLSFTRDLFKKGIRRRPADARVVFFAGRRKPWHDDVLAQYPWINDCVGAAHEHQPARQREADEKAAAHS